MITQYYQIQIIMDKRILLYQKQNISTMQNYEILSIIGEGAYGIVLKARNKVTNQIVAIKKFKQHDEDQMIRKIIMRQIQVLKSLKNNNIVQLLQAFKKKGIYYLVFQYLDNNLLEVLQRSKNGLNKKLIANLIYQILEGLAYMHSRNYIHRDIKPQNLLVNDKYELKICDMGFARSYNGDPSVVLTDYVATRWYRSPQLLLNMKYGPPADIWATGCLMAQLIDGNPLFPGDNETDQIKKIQKFFSNDKIINNEKQKILRDGSSAGYGPALMENLLKNYRNKISMDGLNLLKKMLELNPQKRITAKQSLSHPFFASVRNQMEKNNSIVNLTLKKIISDNSRRLSKLSNKQNQLSQPLQKTNRTQNNIDINQSDTILKNFSKKVFLKKGEREKDFFSKTHTHKMFKSEDAKLMLNQLASRDRSILGGLNKIYCHNKVNKTNFSMGDAKNNLTPNCIQQSTRNTEFYKSSLSTSKFKNFRTRFIG